MFPKYFWHVMVFVLSQFSLYRTAIGLRCKDGIVLAVEKIVPSKMLESTSNKRIGTIDEHVGCVSTEIWLDPKLSNIFSLIYFII